MNTATTTTTNQLGNVERCPYLLNCRNYHCKLYHPDESIELYRKRMLKNSIYTEAQRIISNPTLLKQYFEKSKFCKYKEQCKLGSKCTYAHNMDEYKPPQCFYKDYCTNKDCALFHPWDCVYEYLNRKQPTTNTTTNTIKNQNVFSSQNRTFADVIKKIDEPLPPPSKTDLCPYMSEIVPKCTRFNCGYAHTLWELKPKVCANDHTVLSKESCLFYHEGEDKMDYFIRSGISKTIKQWYL